MKKAGKIIYVVLLSLLIVTLGSIGPVLALEIIYPKNNSYINSSSTFFVGNTQSDASLRINNERVKVYPNGSFVHVTQLKPGANQILITSSSPKSNKKLTYTISTPEPEKTIPKFPLKINQTSVQPAESIVYHLGDAIQVSFKGSPGCKAYFSIGKKRLNIPMTEQMPKFSNSNAAVTVKVKGNGLYKGSYKIQDKDIFNQEAITVQLLADSTNFSYTLPATLSTIPPDFSPIIAVVKNDNATVRTAPDKTRLTPLPADTILNLTGKIGKNYRYKMGETLSGWISEDDVTVLPEGTPFYQSLINLVNISSNDKSVYFNIPLAQKQPFIIEQSAENELYLKIYGASSTPAPLSYANRDGFLKEVKLTQETQDIVKINIKTNARQLWGYKYRYEGENLVLELKKTPLINPDKPLENIIICIDPGHGGKEAGSIGPTGVPEKKINLEIALKLKKLLEDGGAKVLMTRMIDEDADLYDRVKYAAANDAQILLSLHNNALPDGKNPYTEHGTSTYYYHSQSLPLAKILHKALLEDVGFRDNGLYWNSFALTRPTEQPSLLLELGFMIHPDEYALLLQPEFQDKIAASITRGLTFYMFTNTPAANQAPTKQ